MDKATVKLKEFLEAWKEKDFERMYGASQLTWKETHKVSDISNLFENNPIIDFEIGLGPYPGDNLADIVFRVRNTKNGRWSNFAEARLLRESAPYTTDATGTWGVNPISIIRVFSTLINV